MHGTIIQEKMAVLAKLIRVVPIAGLIKQARRLLHKPPVIDPYMETS